MGCRVRTLLSGRDRTTPSFRERDWLLTSKPTASVSEYKHIVGLYILYLIGTHRVPRLSHAL